MVTRNTQPFSKRCLADAFGILMNVFPKHNQALSQVLSLCNSLHTARQLQMQLQMCCTYNTGNHKIINNILLIHFVQVINNRSQDDKLLNSITSK